MTIVRTVLTDDGKVITGAVKERKSDLFEDIVTLLCPPIAAVAIAEELTGAGKSRSTVVWNGQTYSGKVIK